MARIHLVLTDEDRDSFAHEAQREGLSLSEWLRLAAKERLQRQMARRQFRDEGELDAFFGRCDTTAGADSEPDWEDHLKTIARSRSEGAAPT